MKPFIQCSFDFCSSKSRVKGYLKLQLSFLASEDRLVPQSETPGKHTFMYSTYFCSCFINRLINILALKSCHVEGDLVVGLQDSRSRFLCLSLTSVLVPFLRHFTFIVPLYIKVSTKTLLVAIYLFYTTKAAKKPIINWKSPNKNALFPAQLDHVKFLMTVFQS